MKLEIWLGNAVDFFTSGIVHQDDGTTYMLQQNTSSKITTLYFKKDKSSFPDMVLTWNASYHGITLIAVDQRIDEVVFHNGSLKDISVEPARGQRPSSIVVHLGESKAMNWQLKYV